MKLKTKILLGISFLLLSALSLNLFYSYKIISADKKAYIFENSLNQVEKLSNDLVTRLRQIYAATNTYWYLSQNSPQQLINILNSQDFILGIQIENNQLVQNYLKEDDSVLVDLKEDEIKDMFQRGADEGPGLSQYKFKDLNILRLLVRSNGIDLTYLLDAGLLENLFSRFGIFNSLLLINDKPVLGDDPGETLLNSLLDRKEVKASYITNDKENELLVSFSKFEDLGLALVSYATTKDAYDFLNQLVYRSLFFGLVILGFSLILGLFFSYQVTGPIVSLTGLARLVALGDYSQKADIKTKDEIRVLGDTFNQMSLDISSLLKEKEVMIQKLEDYNLNLEKKVDERTKQLKEANTFIEAMINSLDQGLFVIDKNLDCMPTYTKACSTLFDKKPENLKFQDLLGLDGGEIETLQKWANILFSEKIPFDSAKNLGPKEKVFQSDDDFRHVAMDYYPMRDDDNSVSHVVVVATDKTNEVRAIQQFEEKTAYVEMVLKLIRLKNDFFKFLDQSEKMLEQLADLLSLSPVDPDQCLFIYHSLNGGFGSFSIRELQQKARSSEQIIVDWRATGKPIIDLEPILKEDFKQFCILFSKIKSDLLSIFDEKTDYIEIDRPALDRFESIVNDLNISSLTDSFVETFLHKPIEDYFKSYEELIVDLSKKLDKPMNPLNFISNNIRLPNEIFDEFFAVLIHLFRNTMDHAIESRNVRADLEKPVNGTITITTNIVMRENTKQLRLDFSDDGAGIAPEKIRRVWNEKNPEKPIDNLSDQEVIFLIFDANFSTSAQLSDLSGRGVGMSSVKDVVTKLKGEIFVDSEVMKGTTFVIYLPLSSENISND